MGVCAVCIHALRLGVGKAGSGFGVQGRGGVVRSDDPTIFCLMLGGGGWILYMKLLEMT